jgi:hypothetical protein
LAALPAGPHSITAVYGGDLNFLGATSSALGQNVAMANTTTVLVSNVNPASLGQPVTLAAAVIATPPGAGTPSGTVEFREGATVLATVALNGLGQAGFTTTTLPLGPHAITATYSGDANFIAGTSAVLSEVIFTEAAPGVSFVIGDQDAVIGAQVTFWSSKWDKANHLTGGPPPSAFNGFASALNGASWSGDPANSSAPPAAVPAYMAVIAASTITQSGPTITGDVAQLVVIRTDPGYAPDAGHTGTGTVIAIIPK